MIENERNARCEHVLHVARQIMTAARTAPKARGMDVVEIALVTGDEKEQLSQRMEEMGSQNKMKFFLRDADNVRQAEAVILIGTRDVQRPRALNCGYCGFPNCASKPENVPCTFSSLDVGIAIGTACAMATDLRVDTRVMYSVGSAAQKMELLKDCGCVLALLLSVSSKSPFFDRKWPK